MPRMHPTWNACTSLSHAVPGSFTSHPHKWATDHPFFITQQLKGTVSRDFRLLVFSWIYSSFPQAPEYILPAISNFFENSRRYSRLKVHHRCRWHRWQMENKKNFNYFVWTPLGNRVTMNTNFCLQVHFKESAAWYFFHILPPVSLIPVANLTTLSTTLAKLVAKFATGVVDTGGAPWLVNISANFRKNSKRS